MDAAINPTDIPDKAFSKEELEDFILFSILVANKEATQTRNKLNRLYDELRKTSPRAGTAFGAIRRAIAKGSLLRCLTEVRTGQYTRIEQAFREVINLDLSKLSVQALESVHGIGPKTARFIMLYAFPGVEVAPLDTHVLKYLRELGYEDVPKSTPSPGKTYEKWEKVFIEEARRRKMTVRELDTLAWQKYATSFKKAEGSNGNAE